MKVHWDYMISAMVFRSVYQQQLHAVTARVDSLCKRHGEISARVVAKEYLYKVELQSIIAELQQEAQETSKYKWNIEG